MQIKGQTNKKLIGINFVLNISAKYLFKYVRIVSVSPTSISVSQFINAVEKRMSSETHNKKIMLVNFTKNLLSCRIKCFSLMMTLQKTI